MKWLPDFAAAGLALSLAALIAPTAARAQQPQGGASAPEFAPSVVEELLGYDATRRVIAYVERTPSGYPGFRHVSVVELPLDGVPHLIRLTTDEDINQMRQGPGRDAARAAVEARVRRDLDAARERYQPGTQLPVSDPSPPNGCLHPPYAAREFTVGDGMVGHAAPSADGNSVSVYFSRAGHDGPPTEVPSAIVNSSTATVRAAYTRIADARELPGVDRYVVLLRSEACTPESSPVPARAVIVAAPPPPEQPLAALPHAELNDWETLHVLAPRARRRTVDDVEGYYEGHTQVVFDTAWAVPGGEGDRLLVQYTRRDANLPPTVADLGQATTTFALMRRLRSGRLRLLSQALPPAADNVFEGVGQEAYATDLDGDGTPEILVRARYRPDGEVTSMLHLNGDALQYVWRGVTGLDQRGQTVPERAEHRTCTLGTDARTLVVRCQIEYYRPNAAPNDPFLSCSRLVQRLRWNGGMLQINEERR